MGPLVSIITVVFNGQEYLEKTICSVKNQTYKFKELIIIDGGSKDKTLDIIRNYNDFIKIWISEKDSGIYDAMNKGIGLAQGDWILFLNGGDELFSETTLEQVFDSIAIDSDLTFIHGDSINVYGNFKKYIKAQEVNVRSLRKGMVVNHQSILVKKNIAPMYDLNFKISADYNWIVDIVKNSKLEQLCYLPIPIAKYSLGGISENKILNALNESIKVTRKHFGAFQVLKNSFLYLKIILRYLKNKYLGYEF